MNIIDSLETVLAASAGTVLAPIVKKTLEKAIVEPFLTIWGQRGWRLLDKSLGDILPDIPSEPHCCSDQKEKPG